ncbi:dnaJ homolog subfamily C member 28-like [Artemia franciscana]|uniref:dnaJ homolog subfamily C member 28-like n=1 Tax=Artemia franciscana TaxID=6661 RepID=UPI0032DAB82B
MVAFSNFVTLQKKMCIIPTISSASIRSRTFSGCQQKEIENYTEDYRILEVKKGSDFETIRGAFFRLAKIYHPDSGSESSDAEKFKKVEQAYRRLQEKLNKEQREGFTGAKTEELSRRNEGECDIEHTAPQHRQFLSYEGYGHGSLYQREKQHRKRKAEKATENVFLHRMKKAGMLDENSLVAAESKEAKKIKTRYDMDRLVEDLIRESMERGEFTNIKGTGKPLKERTSYPYVDEVTRKINEILIDNGFTPPWVSLHREIREEISDIRKRLEFKRQQVGDLPLTEEENQQWEKFKELLDEDVKRLNKKINDYNLVVPSLHKQMLHFKLQKVAERVLVEGRTKLDVAEEKRECREKKCEESEYGLISAFKEVFLGKFS